MCVLQGSGSEYEASQGESTDEEEEPPKKKHRTRKRASDDIEDVDPNDIGKSLVHLSKVCLFVFF